MIKFLKKLFCKKRKPEPKNVEDLLKKRLEELKKQ